MNEKPSLTTEQQEALYKIWSRPSRWPAGERPAFNEFYRSAVPLFDGSGCVMVHVGCMYLGIETDGYTHS